MCMMKSIHAKSYTTIFTTVNNTAEIDEIFECTAYNEQLQFKAKTIDTNFRN